MNQRKQAAFTIIELLIVIVVADEDVGKATPKAVGIVHIHDCLRAGVA